MNMYTSKYVQHVQFVNVFSSDWWSILTTFVCKKEDNFYIKSREVEDFWLLRVSCTSAEGLQPV